jgi:hypothetical protein
MNNKTTEHLIKEGNLYFYDSIEDAYHVVKPSDALQGYVIGYLFLKRENGDLLRINGVSDNSDGTAGIVTLDNHDNPCPHCSIKTVVTSALKDDIIYFKAAPGETIEQSSAVKENVSPSKYRGVSEEEQLMYWQLRAAKARAQLMELQLKQQPSAVKE